MPWLLRATIGKLPKDTKLKADTMIGILWSFGMALGILFIAIAPGYMPDMTSYLFGDILSVSTGVTNLYGGLQRCRSDNVFDAL